MGKPLKRKPRTNARLSLSGFPVGMDNLPRPAPEGKEER